MYTPEAVGRETETETDTDGRTDRQPDGQRQRHRHRHRHRERERERERGQVGNFKDEVARERGKGGHVARLICLQLESCHRTL